MTSAARETLTRTTRGDVPTGHDLAMALRIAYLTMHRRANADFARFGLTADQFVLLTVLAEGDGVTQKEIARRIDSDPNSTSEMLGRLERQGLVVRERHATDGRARIVRLTDQGRELQRRAWEGGEAHRRIMEGLFSENGLEMTVAHLERIARALSVE
jgi:DNA-binding MarR family transcriptional regulator